MQTAPPTPTILTLDEDARDEAHAHYKEACALFREGATLESLPDGVLVGYMLVVEASLTFASVELSRRRHLQPLTN